MAIVTKLWDKWRSLEGKLTFSLDVQIKKPLQTCVFQEESGAPTIHCKRTPFCCQTDTLHKKKTKPSFSHIVWFRMSQKWVNWLWISCTALGPQLKGKAGEICGGCVWKKLRVVERENIPSVWLSVGCDWHTSCPFRAQTWSWMHGPHLSLRLLAEVMGPTEKKQYCFLLNEAGQSEAVHLGRFLAYF